MPPFCSSCLPGQTKELSRQLIERLLCVTGAYGAHGLLYTYFKNTNIISALLATNCVMLPEGGERGPWSIINPRLEK